MAITMAGEPGEVRDQHRTPPSWPAIASLGRTVDRLLEHLRSVQAVTDPVGESIWSDPCVEETVAEVRRQAAEVTAQASTIHELGAARALVAIGTIAAWTADSAAVADTGLPEPAADVLRAVTDAVTARYREVLGAWADLAAFGPGAATAAVADVEPRLPVAFYLHQFDDAVVAGPAAPDPSQAWRRLAAWIAIDSLVTDADVATGRTRGAPDGAESA